MIVEEPCSFSKYQEAVLDIFSSLRVKLSIHAAQDGFWCLCACTKRYRGVTCNKFSSAKYLSEKKPSFVVGQFSEPLPAGVLCNYYTL